MKSNTNKHIFGSLKIFVLLISLINIKSTLLSAEELNFNEIELDNSTKLETNSSDLPTNPFEIVEMLKKANSMNEATNPSDAIDDALKLFNKIEEQENL